MSVHLLTKYDRTIAGRMRRDNVDREPSHGRMETKRRSIASRRGGMLIGNNEAIVKKRANEQRMRERGPGRPHSVRYYSADGFTGHRARFVTIGARK